MSGSASDAFPCVAGSRGAQNLLLVCWMSAFGHSALLLSGMLTGGSHRLTETSVPISQFPLGKTPKLQSFDSAGQGGHEEVLGRDKRSAKDNPLQERES